jgi:hypothetical protein
MFFLATASRPLLCSIQSPTKWIPRALSLGVKRPECQANHYLSSIVEVKNAWKYISASPYVFMAWYLHKHEDKFNFAF